MHASPEAIGRNWYHADSAEIAVFSDCARGTLRWNDGAYVYFLEDNVQECMKLIKGYGFSLKPPTTPLVLLSSMTTLSAATTLEEARQWQSEIESLYTAHYGNAQPVWTWNDTHDLDRDVLIELEEIVRAHKAPPLDTDLVCSFTNPNWRETALRLAPKSETGAAIVSISHKQPMEMAR
jgi:hypothetical protein